ncbi:hypothetical protein QEL93_001579 [Pseudomonas putida]|nr:hypothetical protein [Pseudomonas putida]
MTYTLNPELLEWMVANNGLYGYDGLAVVSEGQLNTALAKQHRTRLSREQVLTNITGVLPIPDTDVNYHLAGYHMSAPSLDISRADKFDVTSQLDSGMLVKTSYDLQVEAVSQHDVLDPMVQTCNLPRSPTVSQSLLQLDVASGENMRLDIGASDLLHQYAGEFIQQKMQEQAELNAPYVLAGIGDDTDNALAIKQIDLQTQENPETGRHDLLLWAATKQGKVGKLPANTYIPGLDPAVNTVLASARLMHRISYGQGLTKFLEDGRFDEIRDSENMLIGLKATAGYLAVSKARYTSAEFFFECDAFTVPAHEGLSISFEDDVAHQTWESACTVKFNYKPIQGVETKEFQATFQLNLAHRFNLVKASGRQDRIVQGQLYWPWTTDAQVVATGGLPELPVGERAQIEEFIAHVVKRAMITGLSKELAANAPDRWLASAQVGLDKGLHLRAADVPQGNDAAMVATPTAYRIEPSTAVVLAGDSCDLRIVPSRQNVRWVVQSLPISAEDAGFMEPEMGDVGTYRAALSSSLAGKPSKVLVIAADERTREPLASALVTTVVRAVTVNPMIQTCYPEGELTLTAASLGGGELKWTIRNPVEGQSGSLTPEDGGKRCRYEAAPKVEGKRYILDEIEVEDERSHDKCVVYVLVVHSNSSAQVQLKAPPKEDGSLELVLNRYGDPLDNVTWELPIDGQGEFVEGRYQPGETNEAGFVLVFASGFEGERRFEGHLILPWPLTDFPDLCKQLIEQ